MTKEEKFIYGLRQILQKNGGFQPVVQAIVVESNESTCKVKLTDNDMELDGILYSSTEGNTNGFILVPKEGTNVLIGLIGGDENSLYLIKMDEVKSVKVTIEDKSFTMDENETIFNDGANGGLVISGATNSVLNDIKSDLNDLKTIFTTWIPAPADGGTALKSLITGWAAHTLTPGLDTDLENDNVKH